MKRSAGKNYHIERNGDTLIFRTSSFLAEKGSVLHSDIYNREFTSTLPAMTAAVLVYMLLIFFRLKTSVSFMLSAVVFILGFVFFRTFIFRGKYLETVFNKATGKAKIFFVGITKREKETLSIRDITGIFAESRSTGIENPDGVAFVEKISAQHGVAIPGFGEDITFYMLKIKLADGTERMIYADKTDKNVLSALNEIKNFLNK